MVCCENRILPLAVVSLAQDGVRHGIQAFDRATILFQLVTSGVSLLCAF